LEADRAKEFRCRNVWRALNNFAKILFRRAAARQLRAASPYASARPASEQLQLFSAQIINGHVHVGRKVNAWSEEVLGCVVVVVVV
jgi:hypothetical protein